MLLGALQIANARSLRLGFIRSIEKTRTIELDRSMSYKYPSEITRLGIPKPAEVSMTDLVWQNTMYFEKLNPK